MRGNIYRHGEWVFATHCPSRDDDDDNDDVPPIRCDDDVLFLRLTRNGKEKKLCSLFVYFFFPFPTVVLMTCLRV